MENTSANFTNASWSAMFSPSFRAKGIASCSVFMLEAVLIVSGNLLTIVLFALEKTLRKKSLFLVVNMAFADMMLGAVSVPLYIYLSIGFRYQLWSIAYDHQVLLTYFFLNVDNTFLQASLISAVFISCERFYAVYWPLKHRTLSMSAYAIAITIIWTLAIITTSVYTIINTFISSKASHLTWAMVILIYLFILCGCNIGIWRKFQQRNNAFYQQNRDSQNQHLTKTLLSVSAAAVILFLPHMALHCLTSVCELSISFKFFHITVFLNYSNSFVNPVVYVLKIPEFRQTANFCRSRCQTAYLNKGIEGRDNIVYNLTSATQLGKTQTDAKYSLQLAFEQDSMDSKL